MPIPTKRFRFRFLKFIYLMNLQADLTFESHRAHTLVCWQSSSLGGAYPPTDCPPGRRLCKPLQLSKALIKIKSFELTQAKLRLKDGAENVGATVLETLFLGTKVRYNPNSVAECNHKTRLNYAPLMKSIDCSRPYVSRSQSSST